MLSFLFLHLNLEFKIALSTVMTGVSFKSQREFCCISFIKNDPDSWSQTAQSTACLLRSNVTEDLKSLSRTLLLYSLPMRKACASQKFTRKLFICYTGASYFTNSIICAL